MPENFENKEKTKVEEALEELRKIDSFTTERGSVYKYDNEGHTTREKKISGENFDPQDITVFVDLSFQEWEEFKNAYSPMKKPGEKVYILERQLDDSPKIIRNINDVSDPGRLYLAITANGTIDKLKKANLIPSKGLYVFDTRHFEKDGEVFTERHIGHKITEIIYKE